MNIPSHNKHESIGLSISYDFSYYQKSTDMHHPVCSCIATHVQKHVIIVIFMIRNMMIKLLNMAPSVLDDYIDKCMVWSFDNG